MRTKIKDRFVAISVTLWLLINSVVYFIYDIESVAYPNAIFIIGYLLIILIPKLISNNNLPNTEYSDTINNAISDNLSATCSILENQLRSALNDCKEADKIIHQQRASLSALDIMLSELHAKYSFHKVSDGWPPKGSNIIVYRKEHSYGIWEDCDPENFEYYRITHWMYMPEEPAD